MASQTTHPPSAEESETSSRSHANAEPTDFVVLYRRLCAEEECRPNSAIIRYMEDRGGHFSLERLNLSHNYLGPRGLRPVTRLIDACQTIVAINLEENGVDNDAVIALCDVLEKHLSISALNLRSNPISVAGGKRLLQLVEANPRITAVELEKTDVFDALQDRIKMALQVNAAHAGADDPQLLSNKEEKSQQKPVKRVHPLPALPTPALKPPPSQPPPKASLQLLLKQQDASDVQATAAAPRATAAGFAAPPESNTTWREAEIIRRQPRPPPPAIASSDHKALTVKRANSIKQLFAERARLMAEVHRSDSSRRAYDARMELEALERHSRPAPSSTTTVVKPLPPLASGNDAVRLPLLKSPLSEANRTGERQKDGGASTASDVSIGGHVGGRGLDSQDGSSQKASSVGPLPLIATEDRTSPEINHAAQGNEADGALTVIPEQPGQLEHEQQQPRTIGEVMKPELMALLTMEEQFNILFDQGCREYMNQHLDAAYVAWNEAMQMAVSCNNREWMAVVASNLQRLSYELLVEEGSSQLEAGELEKANESFKLAYDIAVKANNAAWESQMHSAKQRVQQSLFHRCHEAALLLFMKAQEDYANFDRAGDAVVDSDYFLLPGTDRMVQHTTAFVQEWGCLLLLKEAIGLWAEASRILSRLSDAATAPIAAQLQETLETALTSVTCFLMQTHLDTAAPPGLSWMRTHSYLYYECILLSEVWYELMAYSEQTLHHNLLNMMAASVLSQLYVATYQLPQALLQTNKLITHGAKCGSPLLESTGWTLSGIIHWQRANYAFAELHLRNAMPLWERVHRQSDAAANNAAPSSLAGDAGGHLRQPATPGAAGEVEGLSTELLPSGGRGDSDSGVSVVDEHFQKYVSPDFITVLSNACRGYLVDTLIHTNRYQGALEMLEESLNKTYHDTLHEKLRLNFHIAPTFDEIAAIAGVLKTSLVYYRLMKNYAWDVDENAYKTEDCICIWVVTGSREMRYVEVNLTKDMKCSMHELLTSLRREMSLDPDIAIRPSILTELPQHSWREPLKTLYQACIYPIMGYLKVLDPQLLCSDGVITIVPSGTMWMVPFSALINGKAGDRYLVEEAGVQLVFSATHAAFASLSSERVNQRDLHRDVVVVQPDNSSTAESLRTAIFPFNAVRSAEEGNVVAELLSRGQARHVERLRKAAALDSVVLSCKVDIVADMDELRTIMPRTHALHICTPTTTSLVRLDPTAAATPCNDDGGVYVPATTMGGFSVLRSAEIARTELFAEQVVLTCTNMSMQHVSGTHDAVLGLIRGFASSGVPAVIAGLWCTPDMKPVQLFARYYNLICRTSGAGGRVVVHTSGASERAAAVPHALSVDATGGEGSLSGSLPGTESSNGVDDPNYEDPITGPLSKGLLLAKAVRLLLEEEPEMRYSPRSWAGYYCFGCGS